MLGLGIAACLFGVVLILTRGHPGVLQDWTFAAGDLWAAAGMLVFVIYTVALRRVPASLTPLAQFTVMSVAATLAFVPLAGAEIAAGGVPPLHERTLPWIAALVLLTGIGAYLGYNISLKRNGAVLTSASICLTPCRLLRISTALPPRADIDPNHADAAHKHARHVRTCIALTKTSAQAAEAHVCNSRYPSLVGEDLTGSMRSMSRSFNPK
jgi:hypothetical protein